MNFNKYIQNYFLALFSIIPLTIIAGSAVSVINILLIDLSFIIFIIYKKKFYFIKNKTIIYFFILYFYLIFNSFISVDYSEGFLRNFGFLRIIILFVAINYFFKNEIFFKKVFKFWSLVIFIVLIDVLIESFTGKNILGFGGEIYHQRIVSFFKDEPIVGGYLNGFFLIIIGFLFNEFKDNRNYLIILFSIIFIISILLTGERSNTLKAIFGISFFFILYKNLNLKKKVIIVLTTILLIFVMAFNSNFLKVRFVYQINHLLNQNNIYFKLYDSAFEVFKNHKLLGVGNKNYRVETCNEEKSKKNIKYFCTTHPHQIYFEFLSEHGLIGSIIILSIFYKLIFSKILGTIREKNYVKIGSLIYLLFVFSPVIPSGAFFNNYVLTIFAINLSIFYASDKNLNIFKKIR
ncbi:O-antigen ligase family protein [Candidatus Pelagibacter sp.]|nr:O-antigen ligase family protein [Candidatus Pelagibacter sp.]